MYTGQLRWPLKSWWWDRLGWRSSLGVAQRCPSPIVGHLAPLAPALVQAHTKLQGLEKVVKLDLEALCWWPSPMWWVVVENTGLCVDVWYFQICFWFWEFPLCSHGDSRHGSGVASTCTRRHQQWVGLGNQTSAPETTSTRIFMKKNHHYQNQHQNPTLLRGKSSNKHQRHCQCHCTCTRSASLVGRTWQPNIHIDIINNNININVCVLFHMLAMGWGEGWHPWAIFCIYSACRSSSHVLRIQIQGWLLVIKSRRSLPKVRRSWWVDLDSEGATLVPAELIFQIKPSAWDQFLELNCHEDIESLVSFQ